jgi:hypothetical protein
MALSCPTTPRRLVEHILIIGIPPEQVVSAQKSKYIPQVLFAVPPQRSEGLQTEVTQYIHIYIRIYIYSTVVLME